MSAISMFDHFTLFFYFTDRNSSEDDIDKVCMIMMMVIGIDYLLHIHLSNIKIKYIWGSLIQAGILPETPEATSEKDYSSSIKFPTR